MSPKIVKISPERARQHVEDNEKFFFPSGMFRCLNDHSHFRPGNVHLLLGRSGRGKSTFARSVLADVVLHSRVLYFSTEETQDEFERMLSYNAEILSRVNESENLHFLHELDLKNEKIRTAREFWAHIYRKLKAWKIKLFIFDNLTASNFYDSKSHEGQVEFFDYLYKCCKTSGVAFFVVAHTSSNVTDKFLFSTESIRGSKGVTNRVEHAYAFQDITASTVSGALIKENFIRVLKGRNSGNTNNTYLLNYDEKKRIYTSDRMVSFGKFKELWRLRDTL